MDEIEEPEPSSPLVRNEPEKIGVRSFHVFRTTVPTSVTIRLWIAEHIFKHSFLRSWLPRRMEQFLDPLPLGQDACALMPCGTKPPTTAEPPREEPTIGERHLRMRTGSDERYEYVLDLKVETYSLYRVGKSWRSDQPMIRQALMNRFLHTPLPEHVRGQDLVIMYVTELLPSDVYTTWFPALARALMNTQVTMRVGCEQARKPIFPTPSVRVSMESRHLSLSEVNPFGVIIEDAGFDVDAVINGLTAVLLVMKAWGHFDAMSKVFSYAPSQIAQEIRHYGLACAIGVQATSHLLDCLLEGLKQHDYNTNQPELLQASTHLLVAHLGRKDYHAFLRRAIPGSRGLVAARLQNLLSIDYGADPLANFANYVKMAALRDGMIWGAMRSYGQDVDKHNEASVAMLQVFATTATSLFSTAVGQAPAGAAEAEAGVQALGSWASWAINKWAGARWSAGELDAAIAARFDIQISAQAKAGSLPGLKQDQWRWKCKCDIEREDWQWKNEKTEKKLEEWHTTQGQSATQADKERRQIHELQTQKWKEVEMGQKLSDENVNLVQGLYLTNVNYVMTFAIDGSVTTRLSTLDRIRPGRFG